MSIKDNKTTAVDYVFREAQVPEPIEKVSRDGYVEYGVNNLQPQFLYQMFYNSPIHGGICSQKADFIAGNGLVVTGAMQSQNEEIIRNGHGAHTLNEIVESVALDKVVLEYFFLKFKKNPFNDSWSVDTISGELIRTNEDMSLFYYSEDWKSGRQSPESTGFKVYKSIEYCDPNTESECIMYVKPQQKQMLLEDGTLTKSVYTVPKYYGALPSIMADIEMNHYHYSEAVNSWTSSTVFHFYGGVPEQHERRQQLKELRTETTDRKKKGGISAIWSDGKERGMEILNLNGNSNDTRYLLTQEHGNANIMLGHAIQTPALFGQLVAGKLGNTTDLETDFIRFMYTYVRPRRKMIVESIVYGLRKLNGWNQLTMDWAEYMPPFIKRQEEPQEPSLTDDQFSKEITEDDIINAFSKCGRPIDSLKFEFSRAFDYESSDADCISEYFDTDLTSSQQKILQLVIGGESLSAMIKALDMSARDVMLNLIQLQKLDLIESDEGYKPTASGTRTANELERFDVVYTYEKRPDAEGPAVLPDGRTRDFCRRLIGMEKAFTRDEIGQIPTPDGRDVWLYRGGWYHDKNTKKNRPSCRHFWKQNVILK